MKEAVFHSLRIDLKEMKLPGMAEELERQYKNPNIDRVPADERISDLIIAERISREEKSFNRRLKAASLRHPQACIDDTTLAPERCRQPDIVQKLCNSDQWVNQGRSVIITGPTGCGKTWLACAIAISVLHKRHRVRYIRTSHLMNELMKAEKEANLVETIKLYLKYDVLIVDDFGSHGLTPAMCRSLFELVESREGTKSTIYISQLPVAAWYDLFQGNDTFADACLDRMLHRAYRIELIGKSRRSR